MISEIATASAILGPFFVLAPTFKRAERLLTNSTKIDDLESARHQLLEFNRLTEANRGFQEVIDVFKGRSSIEDWSSVVGIYPLAFGAYGGGGGWIYLLDDEEVVDENPFRDGDPIKLESVLIVDQWIRERSNRLQTKPIQRVRAIGFALLILSVVLQSL